MSRMSKVTKMGAVDNLRRAGVAMVVLAVLLAAGLTVVGCGKKQEAVTQPPIPAPFQGQPPTISGKKLQIALVPKLLDNPVFQLAAEGAQAAAAELGNVDVIFTGPETADTAKQISTIENLINKRVDGISISCNQGDALVPVINKAIEAGIPTITFDSDAPKSKRITYYGINSFQAGVKQAELLIEALQKMGRKPEGKVVIQSGVAGAPNLEERIDGVKSVLSKYP
ncbi:MAG: substrate-binding domain-containing protein, partial [Armatimonadetes bacterium]|nr:substrate-binding domain-containing protein [Armatimonadota bacterium]